MFPGDLHALDDELRCRLGQCRKDAAAVEPADASATDGIPIEVPGLQLRSRLVRPVVEHRGPSHAMPPIAVDRRHVRPAHAVMGEHLVEGSDAHRTHAAGNHVANRVVDHRGGHSGAQPEAVGQVRRRVELSAADVNRAGGGLAERDDPGIEPVNQRAEGKKIERAQRRDLKLRRRTRHLRSALPLRLCGLSGPLRVKDALTIHPAVRVGAEEITLRLREVCRQPRTAIRIVVRQ